MTKSSKLNITQCVMCGSLDVPNVELDLALESNNKRIKSVKILGAKCSQCAEEYYRLEDLEAIRVINKALNELSPDI
jgi:uncharacterized OB-fold protein